MTLSCSLLAWSWLYYVIKYNTLCTSVLYMLWFNFILGLNFIFFCFKLIIIHYHTQKQRKIKFKPRIKLNHNIYTNFYTCQKTSCLVKTNADVSLLSDWNRMISKKSKPSRTLLFQNNISIFFLRFSLLSLLGYRLANIKKQHFTSN